jgi:hypothetical protein
MAKNIALSKYLLAGTALLLVVFASCIAGLPGRDTTVNSKQDIPPIDLAAPTQFETATFALG